MAQVEPRGYKYAEAAQVLNCCVSTVKNMVRDGELTTFRIGKRGTRVTKASVDKRLAGRGVSK